MPKRFDWVLKTLIERLKVDDDESILSSATMIALECAAYVIANGTGGKSLLDAINHVAPPNCTPYEIGFAHGVAAMGMGI